MAFYRNDCHGFKKFAETRKRDLVSYNPQMLKANINLSKK